MRSRIIGKLFHAGIKILYKGIRDNVDIEYLVGGKVLDTAVKHVESLAKMQRAKIHPDEDERDDVFQRKLDIDFGIPIVMLKGYYHHVFLKERFEIIQPEQKIMVHVKTPSGRKSPNMFFRGIMDGVIRNLAGDNRLYLHEVKTAKSWSDKNDHFLAIDQQTTGYLWMAQQIGLDLTGIIYTVCLKPSSYPNLTKEAKKRKHDAKAEGKNYVYDPVRDYESPEVYLARIEKDYMENPKYYIRKIFKRIPEQLSKFQKELYFRCLIAKKIEESSPFKQSSPMNCPMCDGYDLCQNWSKKTIERWYTERKSTEWDDEIEDILID